MLAQLLEALVKVTLPIAAVSFAVVYWALHTGHLKEKTGYKKLKKEIRQVSKKNNKETGPSNFIHKKWVKLGGGFYGLIGLLTYAVVEGREITSFVRQFNGLAGFIETIDAGLIFGLLLNSLTNFITAITWPAFWSEEIQGGQIWLWFLAAYAGYAAGAQVAQYQTRARQNDL